MNEKSGYGKLCYVKESFRSKEAGYIESGSEKWHKNGSFAPLATYTTWQFPLGHSLTLNSKFWTVAAFPVSDSVFPASVTDHSGTDRGSDSGTEPSRSSEPLQAENQRQVGHYPCPCQSGFDTRGTFKPGKWRPQKVTGFGQESRLQ
jgi:hypothetical protein